MKLDLIKKINVIIFKYISPKPAQYVENFDFLPFC